MKPVTAVRMRAELEKVIDTSRRLSAMIDPEMMVSGDVRITAGSLDELADRRIADLLSHVAAIAQIHALRPR